MLPHLKALAVTRWTRVPCHPRPPPPPPLVGGGFISLVLLSQALQQDVLVGGIQDPGLLQVLLGDVTGGDRCEGSTDWTRMLMSRTLDAILQRGKEKLSLIETSFASVKYSLLYMYQYLSVTEKCMQACVPEELQVVPAVVQKALLIALQAQPLEPLAHRGLPH